MRLSRRSGTAPSQTAPRTQRELADLVRELSRPRRFGRLLGWLVALPGVGGIVARVTRAPLKLRPVSTRITRLHARLLRLSRGRLRRSWTFAAGQPVIALTTTGRRSGAKRTTAVACFVDGDELVLAGMNLGMTRNPSWALNLDADSRAAIDVAGRQIQVVATPAKGSRRDELWRRWVSLQPSAVAFQDLAGREIPLFTLQPQIGALELETN